MGDESITINKDEYYSLLADSKFLAKLYAYGVDNWEGYDAANEDVDEE